MNSISFVILHYNDIETTEQCVQSILNLDYQELIQIVIVDNDVEKTFEERQVLKQKYCNNSLLASKDFTFKNSELYL